MSTQQQKNARERDGQTLPLRLVPLGGLGEIGKNMMAVEYGDDIIIVDAGLMFPDDEMLGVDLVIPDTTYLADKLARIRGVFITHGHEDHIGGLPYILPQLGFPTVYATKLTHGLITVKLRERRMLDQVNLVVVDPSDSIKAGRLRVEFLRVNHSIPDAVAVVVRTPAGILVHTGDYKFDHTPVDELRADIGAFARLGAEGVLVLCGDSTRVESPGYTPSERVIADTLETLFNRAPGRIIIATFASLISRAQMVIDAAAQHDRKVALVGRSMVNNVQMAIELGYLNVPPGILVAAEDIKRVPASKLAIICTGSQGEPTSALTRIANADHRLISIQSGDTVILSSTPIVGNEKAVSRNINNLIRQGAEVFYQGKAQVHVSGHGSREELKLMLALLKPRYVVPVHGEYRMLAEHAKLAATMGVPAENVVIAQDGDVIEVSPRSGIKIVDHVPCGNVYVDGLSVGEIGQVVLRDRQALSQDGILVVVVTVDAETGNLIAGPDLISRGFVYERESEPLMDAARGRVAQALRTARQSRGHTADWGFLKNKIRDTLGEFFYDKLKRRPMILPLIVEV
ncbi:MAG TPA: ribonuclease J [Ktedonobacterales bacterium]|nr:ribonuclease J [Ktedonobacterales bacterium]